MEDQGEHARRVVIDVPQASHDGAAPGGEECLCKVMDGTPGIRCSRCTACGQHHNWRFFELQVDYVAEIQETIVVRLRGQRNRGKEWISLITDGMSADVDDVRRSCSSHEAAFRCIRVV